MSAEKKIESMMQEERRFAPPAEGQARAHVKSLEEYQTLYDAALADPEGFWKKRTLELLTWFKEPTRVLEYDFAKPEIKWFADGELNVAYNCLDRHLDGPRRDKPAIVWQGEPEEDVKVYTYQMLYDEVNAFANVLRKKGVARGDRVALYLPMVPELAIAMLACARIGAMHSIVFAGFSALSLQNRIQDCEAKVLVTADAVLRAGRTLPLKQSADEALKNCPSVRTCVVVRRAGNPVEMTEGRDAWWHEEMAAPDVRGFCEPAHMNAEDILFILYTSGSTGKPKGVVHTTGGYLTYVASTMQYVFDLQEDDVHWCTADIGWVTGHSYIVYGPLALGGTTLMFEGVPTYPHPDRFWRICEKFGVNIFYTAPTVIRSLMREGEDWTRKHDTSALRILGSVGEPINPEAWMWYHDNVGKGKLPIVDTWWQTETGGILISAMPFATPLKPGSATLPLPGVAPQVITAEGGECKANEGGHLVITRPWPGMLRGVFGDPERFKSTYFQRFKGMYESGDGARRDRDGYFWVMGRLDDVINVSGHRMGTAEVESALVSHPAVAEAAVVGMPHAIKGESIYAYVTLKADVEESEDLRRELKVHVRKEIGPIATPEAIQFADGLPKTRSGKIMRRVLRKIAAGQVSEFGDTSTLADPGVVADLIAGFQELMPR